MTCAIFSYSEDYHWVNKDGKEDKLKNGQMPQNKIPEDKSNPYKYYGRDNSGALHFGATLKEVEGKVAESNRILGIKYEKEAF